MKANIIKIMICYYMMILQISAVQIPIEWKQTISNLFSKASVLSDESGCIYLDPLQLVTAQPQNPHSYFCPPIYIWDPIFSAQRSRTIPVLCPEHICELLKTEEILDGSNNARNPRIGLEATGVFLLVGVIYHCPIGNHKIRSTDPRIMTSLSRYSQDVILTHKMACRLSLVTTLNSFVTDGLSFSKMHDIVKEQILDRYDIGKNKYYIDCKRKSIAEDINVLVGIKKTLLGYIPCARTFEDLFKAWFSEIQEQVASDMNKLSSSYLLVDHTFKVTVNVGAIRSGDDRKWVKLYNSLFIVMNEKKEIVSWHFTVKEKFSFVEELLSKLCNKTQIQCFVLDNCCKWEKKIKAMAGQHVHVKLDPFHAIQRIVSTLSKSHPFHKNMCNDLKGFVRKITDMKGDRKDHTDSTSNLIKRLDEIVEKWTRIEHLTEGISLINAETRIAIGNLRRHINKGCLSDIPPQCTTSMNENLHKFLNKLVKGQKMGPELAFAIFTMFFYMWNRKRQSRINNVGSIGNRDSIASLSFRSNERKEAAIFGFGNVPEQFEEGRSAGKWVKTKSKHFHSSFLEKLYMYRHCNSLSNKKIDFRIFTETPGVSDILQFIVLKKIQAPIFDNLSLMGYQRQLLVPICNEDCGFLNSSVAVAIANILNGNIKNQVMKMTLTKRGFSSSIANNYRILKNIKFNNSKIHEISNFLGLSIILFTELEAVPIIPIYSKTSVCSMIWLVLYINNQGLFNPVTVLPPDEAIIVFTKGKKCSCGRKRKKNEKKACTDSLNYATRCPCIKNKKGCDECDCFNCGNPHGAMLSKITGSKTRNRSRPQMSTSRNDSLQFLELKNETPKQGQWSDVECMLLHSLTSKFGINDITKLLDSFNENTTFLARLNLQVDTKNEKELSAKIVSEAPSCEYLRSSIKACIAD